MQAEIPKIVNHYLALKRRADASGINISIGHDAFKINHKSADDGFFEFKNLNELEAFIIGYELAVLDGVKS